MDYTANIAEPLRTQIRFNGGYHDGANAAQNNWQPMWTRGAHFCPVYERGFWAGQADAKAGTYDQNSANAYAAFAAVA